jgi:Protein of unknown function (DUF3617)
MRCTRRWITTVCCLFSALLLAQAQAHHKPGLWESTTAVTSSRVAGAPNPMRIPTRTQQFCATQHQLDNFGVGTLQPLPGCHVTSTKKRADGITELLDCSAGDISGKQTWEMTWVDDDHLRSKLHFLGSARTGQAIELTFEGTTTFKSGDCGNVKPLASRP